MTAPTSHSRSNKELMKALRPPLARFYPFDLHTHSVGSFDVCLTANFEKLPDSLRTVLKSSVQAHSPQLPLSKELTDHGQFDQNIATIENVEAFYQALCARRDSLARDERIQDSDNWALVGITDHNVAHFAAKLSELAWGRRANDRLIILPGLELEVHFPLENSDHNCPLHILCLYQPGTQASEILVAINDCRPQGAANWTFGRPMSVPLLPRLIQQLRAHGSIPHFVSDARMVQQGNRKRTQENDSCGDRGRHCTS